MTTRNRVAALAMLLAVQLAMGASGALAAENADASLHAYAQQCTDEIGEIPAFDCNAGTDVPITVNGRVPARYAAHMTCDRPALLPYDAPTSGQCTPYSKILDLSHGDTQISAFCRRKQIRANRSPYYDEVDIVLHHAGNGKTCWFHAEKGGTAGMNAARVPPPNETTPPPGHPSAAEFWWKPAATASKRCVSCHDASPVMYSPWIGQVWNKVPTDPWGKYVNLGADFASWTSHAISTPGNTCIGCHRIGDQNSCKIYVPLAAGMLPPPKGSNARASRYPLTHWMPIDNNKSLYEWNAANAKSVSDLLECCSARGKNDPKCSFTPAAQAAQAVK
ncbi:hypothetical protein LL998_31040 [Burkholderia ambifaria]|uniref:hypothetical protein n=1 Tax=Burkholderia ambifaria TaxID=152480 RepID=UPI001E602AD9|nr:hypothetical protein [Burkholderia ambifaria]UEP38803.1 hypothetical protein LL998_31040 [Burkholderia ambifaria]